MTPDDKKNQLEGLRSAGLLLSIPALLIASPLVGLFVGMAVDRWLHTGRIFTAIGVVLGFATAGNQTYQIWRRVQQEGQEGKPPKSGGS